MKGTAKFLRLGGLALVLAVALFYPARGRLEADTNINPPPFDFTDEFYRQNGINPNLIGERAGTPARNALHWTFDPTNTDPTRNNARILETTGGFDKDGNLIYYSIMGTMMPNAFTNDAAGARAQQVANAFRAFLFPKDPDHDGVVVLSPAPPNRRQDNIFDTRNAYFCDNQLGLWILAFVNYTQAAFTPEGQAALLPIAMRNGIDLDGTPILKTVPEIDGLVAGGFAQIRNRALDGSQGFPWVI